MMGYISYQSTSNAMRTLRNRKSFFLCCFSALLPDFESASLGGRDPSGILAAKLLLDSCCNWLATVGFNVPDSVIKAILIKNKYVTGAHAMTRSRKESQSTQVHKI